MSAGRPTHQTPAGGHAAVDGATAPTVDGVPQREVAPVPPAGRTIEPTVGIRPACPTCEGPSRETVNMVCQTCGFDYGDMVTSPGACRECGLAPESCKRSRIKCCPDCTHTAADFSDPAIWRTDGVLTPVREVTSADLSATIPCRRLDHAEGLHYHLGGPRGCDLALHYRPRGRDA